MKRLVSRSWAVLVVLVGGCGGTASVSGKVTFDGRPVTYGSVIIENVDAKITRSGVIKPDGSYLVEDVPPGKVSFGVISRDPSKGRSVHRPKQGKAGEKNGAQENELAAKWFPLPPRVETPGGSGRSATIGSGNVRHDLDLK